LLQSLKSILVKDSTRQVGIYTITASFCKAISFAALPFFVNNLGEGDIGILNIFSNCVVFLTPLISMGVLYSFSIDYFKLPRDQYAQVFSTGLVIPLICSLLLIPLLYLLQAPLEKAFNFQPGFFWLIPLCLILNFCFEAFVILVRNQNNAKLFAGISFLKVIVEVGMSIFFIVWLYQDWYSRALGFVISGITLSAVFLFYINKERFLVKRIDLQLLRKELSFGFSGMALQTAIFFLTTSDKFFVMSFFGKNQAGYYSVAASFSTIQYIVCISMLQYLQPVLFSRFAEGKKWQELKGIFYKYFLTMAGTLLAVGCFTFLVYHYMLRPVYKEYLHYFYLLSTGSFLWTIANILLQYIVFNKSKKVILQIASLAITASLGTNYFMSKYLGVNGLASGQIFLNLLIIGVLLLYCKKLNFFAR
jgi:O-antigen/teichoic acid export membrane protein